MMAAERLFFFIKKKKQAMNVLKMKLVVFPSLHWMLISFEIFTMRSNWTW